MPYACTKLFAICVIFTISSAAPVVTESKKISSETRPPKATFILSRSYSLD